MTVWTSLSPSIIQRSIKCKKLLESVKEVIKSQIASIIPLNFHIISLTRQATTPEERSPNEPRRTYYDSPSPDSDLIGFQDHVHRVVDSTSVHQHSPTCTKGPLGHIGCRLSYPSKCSKGNGVSINQLKLVQQKNTELILQKEHSKIDLNYKIIKLNDVKFDNVECKQLIDIKLLGIPDDKCIILELEKEQYSIKEVTAIIEKMEKEKNSSIEMKIWSSLEPELKLKTLEVIAIRNGAVVNYSPTASGTLRCNTAAHHLGANEQAKAIIYYLIKYITKNALTSTTTLSLLLHARQKISLHPSVAENTGTEIRNGQHLLTIMLNKSRSSKEIADTQAALHLLNMPAQFGTVKNGYVFINDACKRIKERIKKLNYENKKIKNKSKIIDKKNEK